jgi:Right handed beta helix region
MNHRRSWLKAVLSGCALAVGDRTPGAKEPIPAPPALAANEVADTRFGVKGDGTTNDRVALQRAIDCTVGKTLVITGRSRIDAKGLYIRSGSHIRFAPGASIKILAHDADTYQVLRIWDVQRVVLENATVDGSKELNAAPSGEQGIGISIVGSSDITLISPTTVNCWGDGIYIAGSYVGRLPYACNIKVIDHHASGCRRQGVSIISARNVVFDHPVWTDIKGTAPSAGLDIEPDHNSNILENIRIISPYTRNCEVGILVWLNALPGPVPRSVSVEISNHRDEASRAAAFSVSGLRLRGSVVTGRIASISPVWEHPHGKGFLSYDFDASGPQIVLTNPVTIR